MPGIRSTPLVQYVCVVRASPAGYEVVAAAYARDNTALDGWDFAGAAYHWNAQAAESMAVRNLQRTMVDNAIRATVVPRGG